MDQDEISVSSRGDRSRTGLEPSYDRDGDQDEIKSWIQVGSN